MGNVPYYFPSDKYEKDYLKMLNYAIENGKPFSIVRIGDGEIAVLQQEYIYSIDYLVRNVPWASGYGYCGTTLPNIVLRDRMITALRNTTIIGWFPGDPPSEAVLKAKGIEPKMSIYAFDNIFLPMNPEFVDILRKHPPLLVGRNAPVYKEFLEKELKIKIPGTVTIEDCRSIDSCMAQMLSVPHEWSLVSAGVNAVVISSEMAYKHGKVSLDAGHMFDNAMHPDYKEYYLKTD